MSETEEKIITTPLQPSDVEIVKSIINKARKAKSLDEVYQYNSELKKIDAINRRKAIAVKVLSKYRNEVPNRNE